ncbi:MAG: hypothetical protein Q8K99_04315 [Actinomycetota bacterium]|nr:hypothetical protein [Actinomycetota bacterium]
MKAWLRYVATTVALLALVIAAGCTASEPQTAAPPAESQSTSQTPTASVETTPLPLKAAKPVIYLYPQKTCEVLVGLRVDGTITHADPPLGSEGAWRVIADPSGTLTDAASGRVYPYLFWEADVVNRFEMPDGFVVAGPDTRAFLGRRLVELGLNAAESAQFIEYWASRMEDNAYNLVRFEGPAYEQAAALDVSPEPDTRIRVFMLFHKLDAPVAIQPQLLPRPATRQGFVLVEWGGAEFPSTP